MSSVREKVGKSHRLPSCPGEEKQNFPMNEDEPGAESDLGIGNGLTNGAQSHSSKERLVW